MTADLHVAAPPDFDFDEVTHTYRIRGVVVPSVTQVLQGAGLVDWTYASEWARERGSLVHKAIALELAGGLDWDSVDESFHPYISAELQVIKDLDLEVIDSELRLFSPTYGTAGTLDRVVRSRQSGDLWLWDTKTGPVVPAYGLQTAAYSEMYHEMTGQRVKRRYGLRVNADGTYELIPFTDRQDIVNFHAALRVVQWKREKGLLAA